MTEPPVVAGAAAPWYQSPVQKANVAALVSALIALSPRIGSWLGLKTPTDVTVWVETVFGFITLAAPVVSTIFRAKSSLQPLTLTKEAAEVHPATIRAEAVARTVEQNAHTAAVVVALQKRKAAAAIPVVSDPVETFTLPTQPLKPWGHS